MSLGWDKQCFWTLMCDVHCAWAVRAQRFMGYCPCPPEGYSFEEWERQSPKQIISVKYDRCLGGQMHRMQWKPEERDSRIDFSGKDTWAGFWRVHEYSPVKGGWKQCPSREHGVDEGMTLRSRVRAEGCSSVSRIPLSVKCTQGLGLRGR